MKDPSKNYKKWKENLHGLESSNFSNPYEARREGSQYWGKYQLGPFARKAIGLDKITWEQFSKNPDMQEAAFYDWCKFLKKYMQPEINKYSGKFINGIQMTESGIIMIAHNSSGAKSHLQSGNIPEPVRKFAKLGGYNLNLE